MYPSMARSYPNKKNLYIRALFWFKKFILLSFSSLMKVRNIAYISGLLFLAVNVQNH